MKKVLLTIFTFTVLLLATTADASLIVNGDFSNGLNGWDVSHPNAVTVENGVAILGHGSIFGSVNTSISQQFYIQSGTESLNISFDLSFKGRDRNVLLNDAAFVVLSTLKMEGWWVFE